MRVLLAAAAAVLATAACNSTPAGGGTRLVSPGQPGARAGGLFGGVARNQPFSLYVGDVCTEGRGTVTVTGVSPAKTLGDFKITDWALRTITPGRKAASHSLGAGPGHLFRVEHGITKSPVRVECSLKRASVRVYVEAQRTGPGDGVGVGLNVHYKESRSERGQTYLPFNIALCATKCPKRYEDLT